MKRRLRAPSPALVISLIALFVALGGTTVYASGLISGRQSSSHGTAANLLRTCKRAIGFPIVALTPNTPALSRANRRTQAAYRKCTTGRMSRLTSAHPKDKAVHDAYHAHVDLVFGIREYRTYGGNVARDDLGQDVLRNAQADIARGRREAKHALAEL
jgi:maltooligosyltrehalose synthase